MTDFQKCTLFTHTVDPKILRDHQIVKARLSSRKRDDIKKTLNKIILALLANPLNFPKCDFLSGNPFYLGNIGEDNPDQKLDFILSHEAPIRVKVNAIMNTLVDTGPHYKKNGEKLVDYILTSNHTNSYITQRRKLIEDLLKDPSQKMKERKSFFWAPIAQIYPEYQKKTALHSFIDRTVPPCLLSTDLLIEPLSQVERDFMKMNPTDSFIITETGLHIYHPAAASATLNSDSEPFIAGIAGHTMLLIELARTFDLNWKLAALGSIVEMINIHHSLKEITDAIRDMDLVDKEVTNKFEILDFLIEDNEANE